MEPSLALVLAIALAIAAAVVLYAVIRVTTQRLPPMARVAGISLTRHARTGEVQLELTTDRGPITLDLSPYLAAAMSRELTGADPRRTH